MQTFAWFLSSNLKLNPVGMCQMASFKSSFYSFFYSGQLRYFSDRIPWIISDSCLREADTSWLSFTAYLHLFVELTKTNCVLKIVHDVYLSNVRSFTYGRTTTDSVDKERPLGLISKKIKLIPWTSSFTPSASL